MPVYDPVMQRLNDEDAGLQQTAQLLGESKETLQKLIAEGQLQRDLEALLAATVLARRIKKRSNDPQVRYHAKMLETAVQWVLLDLIPDEAVATPEGNE